MSEDIQGAIEALDDVQESLEKLKEERSEKILEVEQRFNVKMRPFIEKRQTVICSIPDFWLETFLGHPELSECIAEKDHALLKCLKSLDVSVNADVKSGYCIELEFQDNEYISTNKLWKKILFDEEGGGEVQTSKIVWKPNKDLVSAGSVDLSGSSQIGVGEKRKLEGEGEDEGVGTELLHEHEDSFFSWFADDIEDEKNLRMAEIIKEDIFPAPLKWYWSAE